MADISKTIDIIFGAVDGTSAGISSIKDSLSGVDASVQKLAAPFAEVATSILKFDTALAAVGVGMTAFAVNEAGKFTDSVKEISTLFNATEEETGQLGASLLEFSRDAVFGIDDINDATYIAISTGTEWKDVTTTLTESQKLAVVGVSSLTDSTALLSRTMNAYGADAIEVERYSEALFTTVQNGDTNITALAGALGRVSSSASAANVPIETLGAAVATVTVAGINTNETMTLLNSLFKELLSPTDELEKALGGMTLETDGLQAIMGQLQTETGGSARAMNELFGSQEAARAATILSNDAAGVFTTTMAAMSDEIKAVSLNYQTMADSFELVNQRLQNNLRATFVDFGMPLLDEYGGSINALSEILKGTSFAFKDGAFDEIYSILENAFQGIEVSLTEIGENIGDAWGLVDFSGLADSLDELGAALYDAFVRVFGEIDTSTPEGLAEGLQKAVNILTSLVNVTTGIVEQFDPIFSAIGKAASEISTTSTETEKAIGSFLGAMKALETFGTLLGAATILIKESGTDINNVFDVLTGAGTVFVNTLQVAFDGVALSIVTLLQTIYDAAAKVTFGDLSKELQATSDELALLAEAIGENLTRNIADGAAGLDQLSAGLSGTSAAAGDLESGVDGAATAVKRTAEEAAAAAEGFNTLNASVLEGSRIIDDSGDTWGIVGQDLVNLSQAARDAGVEFSGAVPGIESASSSISGLGGSLDSSTEKINSSGEKWDTLTNTWRDVEDAAKNVSGVIGDMSNSFDATDKELLSLTNTSGDFYSVSKDVNGVLKYSQKAMEVFDDKVKATGIHMGELEENTEQARLTMLKLASDERIANMQMRVDLNIAEIEAQTKIAIASFELMGQEMEQSAEIIQSAFKVLEKLDPNSSAFNSIVAIINEEQILRKEIFDLQKTATEANIDYWEAKTAAMEDGIKMEITADGMEHEIEAFMYKIIEKIHAKAVGDEAEFLLSLGAQEAAL